MGLPMLLAETVVPVLYAPGPRGSWIPAVLLFVIAILFAVGTVTLSALVGPSRTGKIKESTYESGMVPIGDARSRFNVRFYVVAVVFLVIDVEVLFIYPFATIFPSVVQTDPVFATRILLAVLLFTVLLFDSYIYAWKKGVFKWD